MKPKFIQFIKINPIRLCNFNSEGFTKKFNILSKETSVSLIILKEPTQAQLLTTLLYVQ